MSRGPFDSKNALNGLFTEVRVAKTVSNVRELLVVGPIDVSVLTFIVVVVFSCWSIFLSFLEIDFLSLGEPCACWLSPSVVKLKEPIVQMRISLT